MKILVVVDMQNDFISGALGSEEAKKIVPFVKGKIENFDGKIIFTRDTHFENYMQTQEGKNLPVEHCIKGTYGHEICDELLPYADDVCDKITFGSVDLPEIIKKFDDVEEIELCGLCTDICVISNAVVLKTAFPEVKITVDASCCAGVTPKSHNTALDAMRAVQINVVE